MTESIGSFRAVDTYVHLGPNGAAVPLTVTSTFWEELGSGAFSDLGPGRLVSTYDFAEDWSSWERHPGGEEVVVLIAGAMELLLAIGDGEKALVMSEPGQVAIVPRGTWHTANVDERAVALFITEGEGTEHRPRNEARPQSRG